MSDAELVRLIAGNLYKRVSMMGRDEPTLQDLLTERADRLTALADRLDGGVIVPREPTQRMKSAGVKYAFKTDVGSDWQGYMDGLYRAMLAASEARYLSPDEDRALRRAAVRGGKMLDEEAK